MDITPDATDLWEGIAGHFDSISQVLSEFIDNSISNLEAHEMPNRSVYVHVEEHEDSLVGFRIEDNGTGIQNLGASLRLGDRSARETPLNEHGFGLKHALASADPTNSTWHIYTRTEADHRANVYRKISNPYSFDLGAETVSVSDEAWPGYFNGSGTLVSFKTSRSFFNTIQSGIKGYAGFERCLDYLVEELGYTYSGVIEAGRVTITVASRSLRIHKAVPAVVPTWMGFYEPRQGSIVTDLGGGPVTIEYKFGEMDKSDYVRYYKRNQATSGVEIRANGRLLMSNLFKEIWDTEHHPTFNHFLAIINLKTDQREALPRTRTSKTGYRVGDTKLDKLFEWIRSTHPKPHKELSEAVSERELVEQLKVLKDKHIRSSDKHIAIGFSVYSNTTSSPVEVDLYLYDGRDIVLYEAKKNIADVLGVYQLLMYWDGAVADGLRPTEAVLIASGFADGVGGVVERFNEQKDENGENYNIVLKEWVDEGVPYPKP